MEVVMNRELKAIIFLKYGTQEDFAAAIGENPSVVSKVVRNRRKLPQAKKLTWARALGCKPDRIFPGSDDETNKPIILNSEVDDGGI
jgi:transcriptional regulator with XRE-family HTH domain